MAYSVNTFFAGLTDVAPASVWPNNSNMPLDRIQFLETAAAFGFEEQASSNRAPYANFSLPVVASSITGRPDDLTFWDNPGTWADTAYGQGNVQATPIQMAVLMHIIANDGVAVTPRLLPDARNPEWEQRQIPKETAQELQQILQDTVTIAAEHPITFDGQLYNFAGAAQVRINDEQIVAGKTGTAEYDDKPPVQWFAGFAPVGNPEYTVVVMTSQEANVPFAQCSPAAIAGTIFDLLLQAPDPVSCTER
jgi:cell division protein FtsI/penicillin-binding protein 2